jgi:hypothetical protein
VINVNPQPEIAPFERCPALDGCHCVTNSLAKIYYHNNHPLSEDMLLGLGAGMGFIYWSPKGGAPFVGGRGNPKGFLADLGTRTGVRITETVTASDKKAESALVERLNRREPVMVFGDMGFLPWFNFPEYHFGGHAFVICGYDGKDRVLVSDMDPQAGGLKKGFYSIATLEQIAKARGSKFKPFPPKNASLDFDFSGFHEPTPEDIYASIRQTADAMLNAPIKNLGIKGIRHAAKEIQKWPEMFDETALAMNLFNLYIFIEIGGTGGGCFRYMYARFLKEAAQLTGDNKLLEASALIDQSGKLFTKAGLLFKDYEDKSRLAERNAAASESFKDAADVEAQAMNLLMECCLK